MKKIITLFVALASISTANVASAADKEWSIGGLIGYGVGENSFSGLTWGAEVDYMLNPNWSLGVYWSNTTESGATLMPIMLQANYFFADWKGFYAGPRLGITSQSVDLGPFGSVSTSDFTIGAQAGWDTWLATDWSVGINANWNYVMASGAAASLFNFVVPIKFHF